MINGQRGIVAGLRQGQLVIRFDDGRWVGLPEPYVDAGHLDHGYALTAHSAQGATVDRAFVLGSDELYREWGYTALSRHRIEARFYVTATRTYVNQPPEPLEPGPSVTAKVARMLAGSVAKTIAAHDADGALERGDALGARLERLVACAPTLAGISAADAPTSSAHRRLPPRAQHAARRRRARGRASARAASGTRSARRPRARARPRCRARHEPGAVTWTATIIGTRVARDRYDATSSGGALVR